MFAQTGGGGYNLKHKEEVDNLAVQCWPMNKTEIKNNNTVIVHVDQTKEEIIGIKLIYTIKNKKLLVILHLLLSVHMTIYSTSCLAFSA